MSNVYELNIDYYNRNAGKYENTSWYFRNRYKDKMLTREINNCIKAIGKRNISILEIGPGTGYILSKLLKIKGIEFNYTGIEHSVSMSKILVERYKDQVREIKIINASVSPEYLEKDFRASHFDLILGSSILHHLPDYDKIIMHLSGLLNKNGVIYFVREPIYKDECIKSSVLQRFSNVLYSQINKIFQVTLIKKILWPWKLKQEDTRGIAIHMFTDGVSVRSFMNLCERGFVMIIFRKYNRRATGFLSFLENKWMKSTRMDIFGNTMFAIGIQKTS
jgi:ubiquinone/menaquinone biosynthesis C-methylase UbiE